MIPITRHIRIRLAIEPVDFRKGIDGLAAVCRQALVADAMSGVLFVFRSRHGTALKMIVSDGQDYWLAQERRSTGRFN